MLVKLFLNRIIPFVAAVLHIYRVVNDVSPKSQLRCWKFYLRCTYSCIWQSEGEELFVGVTCLSRSQ